jgi:hypothetical protein
MKKAALGECRSLETVSLPADLAVVGGGLAGVCAAITAAREGLKVVLIQDRPVLGGNASSEVRLWALGATSHMGNNNRWAREGGVIDELMVENTYRNPEGNAHLLDALLLEKILAEPNITLLLNTAVFRVVKKDATQIGAVVAFCAQTQRMFEIQAPLFCDASGDGIVGFLAGADFRIGAESASEFNEAMAKEGAPGELLGHSIFFHSRDTGKPVKFIAPAYALKDIGSIPRHGHISAKDHGCYYWWLEYGGHLDTIRESEAIKFELWRVVYGVWNHIKNSGLYPEAENLTLDWVGSIPGKRESRRFEGDIMLTQQDIVEQRRFGDAVSFGGWAIDLHPVDGVYSEKPGCSQWHSKGVYQIPYRCLYSRNITNLFLAGRLISASHIAFGSTRVMTTCAHNAQAVGMAAALCREQGVLPRDVTEPGVMRELQERLLAIGQHIPHVVSEDRANLVRQATASASSEFRLDQLAPNGETRLIEAAQAMLVPVAAGIMPKIGFRFDAEQESDVELQLRASEREGNFTPDVILARRTVHCSAGQDNAVMVDFGVTLDHPAYVFICLMPCPGVRVHLSDQRVTGVLSLVHGANKKVAKKAVQEPPEGLGVDRFEFWIPARRPNGQNMAMSFDPPIATFGAANVLQGPVRPTTGPNAWVAALDDKAPALTLAWKQAQTIGRIELSFDTDFDHPMETVQWGHPEREMPFCVRHYRIRDGRGRIVAECEDNHQTRNVIKLEKPITTDRLVIECLGMPAASPAAIFEIRCLVS